MSGEMKLLGCPFCAAGQTQIQENGRMWTGQRMGDPTSVSVVHWCDPVPGQPSRRIERVGRDEASAIAAWNTRACPPPPSADDGWLPIESAPKDGTHILLANQSGTSEGGWLSDVDHGAEWEGQLHMAGWWRTDGTDWPNTHWRPLPPPPAALEPKEQQ